jgi:hypothetical protein
MTKLWGNLYTSAEIPHLFKIVYNLSLNVSPNFLILFMSFNSDLNVFKTRNMS